MGRDSRRRSCDPAQLTKIVVVARTKTRKLREVFPGGSINCQKISTKADVEEGASPAGKCKTTHAIERGQPLSWTDHTKTQQKNQSCKNSLCNK